METDLKEKTNLGRDTRKSQQTMVYTILIWVQKRGLGVIWESMSTQFILGVLAMGLSEMASGIYKIFKYEIWRTPENVCEGVDGSKNVTGGGGGSQEFVTVHAWVGRLVKGMEIKLLEGHGSWLSQTCSSLHTLVALPTLYTTQWQSTPLTSNINIWERLRHLHIYIQFLQIVALFLHKGTHCMLNITYLQLVLVCGIQ